MGAFAPPFIFTEAKKAQEVAFNNTMPVETLDELAKAFGRKYNLVKNIRR